MIILFSFILIIFGSIAGSFASALIPRLRDWRPMFHARSECPHCKHTLGWIDLIPIFSYLFLFGKCRFCKKSIPPYHLFFELLMIGTFLSIWFSVIDLTNPFYLDPTTLFHLVFFLFAGFVGVIFTLYDILYMEIPDVVILPFLMGSFFLLLLASNTYGYLPEWAFGYFLPFSSDFINIPLINAMIGWVSIFLFFLIQILLSKGAWMGWWDLRIALFMGFIAGAKIAWLGLFLAYLLWSIIGIGVILVAKRKNHEIPFGPYLAIGIYLSLAFHEYFFFYFSAWLL